MAIVHLTEASSGAPRLSGTNGDLCLVLDWALVQNGWTIDFSSGFQRCYRAASGNRFPLFINHDSAVSGNAGLAVVRGAESQSAGTLTDAFPTVALLGNTLSNWLVSSTASTTSRAFDLFIGPTFIIYCVNFSGTTNVWEWGFYGDISPSLSGDSYNTLCLVRNITTASTATMYGVVPGAGSGNAQAYLTRSYDGTVKSTTSGITAPAAGTSTVGKISGYPAAFAGPSTGLDTQKIAILDSGSQTLTLSTSKGLPTRGWLPNLLYPMHNGTASSTSPNARDTYTNTSYSSLFIGIPFMGIASINSGFVVVEATDTWGPPI